MNLIEALETAGIEYRESGKENDYWICCPFCIEKGESPDTRFRCGVNVVTGEAHCFNCEWSGRGEYTFQEFQRVLDTGEITAQQEERKHKHKSNGVIKLPEDFELLHHPSLTQDHWNNVAYRYVARRGVSRQQIKDKKIGYCTVGDFHHRVVIPVYYRGKLRGLVGRDFTDKQEPKYRNSVGAKTLYNLPDKPQKAICLVEGVFDALAVERGSRKLNIDAAAVLGHSLKDEQLELLEPYKTIYLWPDFDLPGVEGAISIAKKFPRDKVVRCVVPRWLRHEGAEEYDPSEADHQEVAQRLTHAKVFMEELQMQIKNRLVFDE